MSNKAPASPSVTTNPNLHKSLLAALLAGIFCIYYWSNQRVGAWYDYTSRIAGAHLQGQLGLSEPPPSWLNEMIPFNGMFYSAFPLGSVLTMLPVALLQKIGLLKFFPGFALAAFIATLTAWLLFALSGKYEFPLSRRLVLTLLPLLGTWMWANLSFAGAWHLALGCAVAAQLGALYFILLKRNWWLAGTCFALAFGNRTEVLLLAPLFFWLIAREAKDEWRRALGAFICAPLLLGLATLGYNAVRFGSPFDFGYARIPGVLDEPWYRDGIFALSAIPRNAYAMLLEPWQKVAGFPYLLPTGWGGSIFLSCPYLLFLFRLSARDHQMRWLAVVAILILTFVLWIHGNPGGWQYSYRYAMVLLPWFAVIWIENSPPRVGPFEWLIFTASVLINAWATWLFLGSPYMTF